MSNPVPSSLALITVAPGAGILSADHRTNYSDIQARVNALIAALGGGVSGQVLQAAGAAAVQWAGAALPAAPVKYGTLIDIVSSVAETDILQAAGYAIPGNTLGVNGDARIALHGDYLNNTGGTTTLRLKVYWGGANVIDTNVSFAVSASATRRTFRLELLLSNLGATNSQFISGEGVLGEAGSGGAGIGSFDKLDATVADGQYIDIASNGVHAVDTTASATIRVTATLSSNSASHELRVRKSLIEFI